MILETADDFRRAKIGGTDGGVTLTQAAVDGLNSALEHAAHLAYLVECAIGRSETRLITGGSLALRAYCAERDNLSRTIRFLVGTEGVGDWSCPHDGPHVWEQRTENNAQVECLLCGASGAVVPQAVLDDLIGAVASLDAQLRARTEPT